jgi:curved DNA-binding protein
MAKRDYYEILGISKTAPADEIKKAHRKLALKFHPDRNKDNKGAEEKFKEIQEAYDVLSDQTKRANYDQFGHAGVGGGGPNGANPYEAFRRAQGAGGARTTWRPSPGVSVEDFDPSQFGGAGGDFSEMFEQLFGGRGGAAAGGFGRGGTRGRGPAPTPRGQDVEHGVTLSFEDAARGKMLPLQISRGPGHGETIEIKIPPGVKDGSRIRIKGRGEQTGGEPGDLFIITQVLPHPYFRRDGLDIYLDVPLSMYEALLGTKVQVPTLDGPVTVTIPPGTGSGAKLRIKGRGVERGNEKGDQYAVTKIVVPKQLDEQDQKLVKDLEARHPVNARADLKW